LATPTRAQSARALPAAMASKAASSAAPISTGGGKKKQSSRGHGDGSDPGAYSPTHSLARRPSFGHYPDLQGISPMLGQSKPQVAAKMKQTGRAHKPGFHHTDQRRLVMDMGDAQSPGPGAYLPASTFGKHATYLKSSSSNPSRPSAVFRSGSPSRPRPINEHVPGPGAHTPNFGCQEKNVTNSAPHLKAKGIRPFSDWSADDAGKEVGPGAYESHVYRSLQKLCNEQIDRMSKQNPGFGIAGPAHELPHEQPVEDNTMYPGPGKYETNTSEIAKANGHGSVFSPPTRRKGSKTADIAPEVPRTGGKKGKAKSKAPKVEGGA